MSTAASWFISTVMLAPSSMGGKAAIVSLSRSSAILSGSLFRLGWCTGLLYVPGGRACGETYRRSDGFDQGHLSAESVADMVHVLRSQRGLDHGAVRTDEGVVQPVSVEQDL